MSRAAVLDAILNDPQLIAAGFDSTNVLPNFDGSQRPSDKMFMVLRWETEDIGLKGDDSAQIRGGRHVAIWVHMYREFSTDFVRIDNVLKQIDDVLCNMVDVVGADGSTVTCIEQEGHSRDLRDDGYQTFCRSASYKVIGRIT